MYVSSYASVAILAQVKNLGSTGLVPEPLGESPFRTSSLCARVCDGATV